MKRQVGLVIVLVVVITLLLVAVLDGTELGCTLRCQGIEEEADWEACMLECHRGLR